MTTELPLPSSQDQTMDILSLSLDQLNSIRTQYDEELLEINRQLEALYSAKSRFNSAKVNISELDQCADDDRLLVPLNQSLYVPGRVMEPKKVIVELGTGYFCEKELSQAKELLDRKVRQQDSYQ